MDYEKLLELSLDNNHQVAPRRVASLHSLLTLFNPDIFEST